MNLCIFFCGISANPLHFHKMGSCCCCTIPYNRIIYLFLILIPIVCNIVFMFHPEYFDNKFWALFPAYKNPASYALDWIMNIRFVFTYFVFHLTLLVFSLFQLSSSTMPIAKLVHRGMLWFKIPFLIGFFFLTFAFPNIAMQNF